MIKIVFCIVLVFNCVFSKILLENDLEKLYSISSEKFSSTLAQNLENSTLIDARCSADLILLNVSNEPWALQMIDATGKLPSGILRNNWNSFGDFDECLSIEHTFPITSKRIQGKYCLAQFPIIALSDSKTRLSNAIHSGYVTFNLGICIPESCTGSDIQTILNLVLNGTKVSDEYCSTSDYATWDAADWCNLGFFIFFGSLIALSTTYELYHFNKKSTGSKSILLSFSLITNTRRLFKTNPGNLRCLNGIRALSMLWIILSHRYYISLFFPLTSINDGLDWTSKYSSMIVIAAPVAVDTFLLLSGMLLSYVTFKQFGKRKNLNLPVFYVHRILRLTPALAAIVFLQATLYRHLGSGPLWPMYSSIFVKNCQDNWWSALLYVHNYVNPNSMCMGQTWYLAVDMQLYILSPILLYPLLFNKKIGLVNMIFWIVVSYITLATLVVINEWAGATISFGSDSESRSNGYYYATHTRAHIWLIGFAFGYFLHSNSNKKFRISKVIVIFAWLASFAIMASVIFGMKPLQDINHKFSYAEDGMYNIFARSAWVMALMWFIFACLHGNGGPIDWFLSWPIWEVLGRLSYSMYLLHQPIQFWMGSVRRIVMNFSHELILYEACGDIIFSVAMAYFWAMTFESPILLLEKHIFREKSTSESKETLNASVENVITNTKDETILKA